MLLFGISMYSQIDVNSLMTLPTAADISEINSVTNPNIGSIVFNLDDGEVYRYTGTTNGWQKGFSEPRVYVGSFIISQTSLVQNITGLPFKPSTITFTAHANVESFNINSDNDVGNNNTGINNSFGSMNGFARLESDGTTRTQNVIYVGGHGNSINDISRFSSDVDAVAIRYGSQNGDFLGSITSKVTTFNTDGFTVTSTYTIEDGANTDVNDEDLIVLYTAYK